MIDFAFTWLGYLLLVGIVFGFGFLCGQIWVYAEREENERYKND